MVARFDIKQFQKLAFLLISLNSCNDCGSPATVARMYQTHLDAGLRFCPSGSVMMQALNREIYSKGNSESRRSARIDALPPGSRVSPIIQN